MQDSPSDSPTSSPAAAATAPAPTFWKNVIQALKGEHHDYTDLPLNRAVLLLAVPMVLEMIMESLFAITDIYWVSRLGRDAVTVVGVTEVLMTLIYAVAIGISMAATAVVARRIGEKDPEAASRAAGQILLLGVVLSTLIGVVMAWATPWILRQMISDEAVVQMGIPFARIMLGGNATVFLIFLINAVFRGAGDAVIAMRTLWLANALNIVLGPCFIFGLGPFPEMGVAGAAVATNIGRGTGVIYQLWKLAGKDSRIRLRLRHLKPERGVMTGILRTSSTGIAQFAIGTTSWVGLMKILTAFGSSAQAGYTIAIRVVVFALMPAWGLANAGATLVGQNLGAGKPDRAEAAVKIAMRLNVLALGVVGLIFVVFAGPIAGLFSPDAEVLGYAKSALWIIGLAFPLYAAGMCLEGAFNGAGDTWTPTKLNFFCYWMGQIPLAWVLADLLRMGPVGVFIAVPISFSALALASAVLFRRGKWKLQKI